MTEEIYAIAAAMAQPDEGEAELLEMLCAASAQQLTAALGEGRSPEDCREAFLCAAAALAAAGLLSSRGGQAEDFTVGEVTVRASSGGGKAQQLRQLAADLMAPYSGTDGFAFLGVEG